MDSGIKNYIVRNTFLLLVLSLLLFPAACKKENTVAENMINGLQSLPGIWELRSAKGGYAPGYGGDFTAGNRTTWNFTDSTYKRYSKGNFYDSGMYRLSSGINPATSTTMDAMLLNNDTTLPFYFHIADDTLTLYIGVIEADGVMDKYVRIENP